MLIWGTPLPCRDENDLKPWKTHGFDRNRRIASEKELTEQLEETIPLNGVRDK